MSSPEKKYTPTQVCGILNLTYPSFMARRKKLCIDPDENGLYTQSDIDRMSKVPSKTGPSPKRFSSAPSEEQK